MDRWCQITQSGVTAQAAGVGGAESMIAVSKQRNWYVHKKNKPCRRKDTAMSRSVRSRIEDFEALSRGSGGEARDSSKDRRNEVVTEKRKTRVCARRIFVYRRMLRLVSLWLCIDIDLRHRQVLEMIFALV